MSDIYKLLNGHRIAQESSHNRKWIVALAIQEYVNAHGVLLEREVELAVAQIARQSNARFPNLIETLCKPNYNRYIGELGIKYMYLQDALSLTLSKRQTSYEVRVRWVYEKRARKGTSIRNCIIFYNRKDDLKRYINGRLGEPQTIVERTFTVPRELAISPYRYKST